MGLSKCVHLAWNHRATSIPRWGLVGFLLLLSMFLLVLFLQALLLSAPSYAINRCVSDDGKVSYQDMPCPEASVADVVEVVEQNAKVDSNQVQLISVLHQGLHYLVGVPKSWTGTIKTSQSGEASTLRVKPHSGSDITLLMTFIHRHTSNGSSASSKRHEEVLGRVMFETDMKYMTQRSESKLNSHDLSPLFIDGKLRLSNYVDRTIASRKNRIKGEYAYVTAGALVSDDLLINITILSHSLKSDNYAKAFVAAHTVAIKL